MKLSQDDVKHLKEILNICSMTDIDSIIINDGVVRGANMAKTCAIISNIDVPKFSQKIGLSRLGALRSRLDLFNTKDVIIDAKETDRGEISQLDMSAGKSKVQFRCTSSALIKAPSSINDEHCFNVFMSKDEAKTILDAIRVMGARKIILSIMKRTVALKISDESNDAFSIELSNPPEIIGNEDSAVITYSTQVLPAIIKFVSQDFDRFSFRIGQKGTAVVKVINREVTILPEFNEEDE